MSLGDADLAFESGPGSTGFEMQTIVSGHNDCLGSILDA